MILFLTLEMFLQNRLLWLNLAIAPGHELRPVNHFFDIPFESTINFISYIAVQKVVPESTVPTGPRRSTRIRTRNESGPSQRKI